jgi:hypothetical protein
MPSQLENIVRPWLTPGVEPKAFDTPGAVGVPPSVTKIGFIGGTKTFAYSGNVTVTFYMGTLMQETQFPSWFA